MSSKNPAVGPAFDPSKPFGTICGRVQGAPRAKYEQNGHYYDYKSKIVGIAPKPEGDEKEVIEAIQEEKAAPPPAPPKPDTQHARFLREKLADAEQKLANNPEAAPLKIDVARYKKQLAEELGEDAE